MLRYLSLIIIFVAVSFQSFATHNRAGEITYIHTSGLSYEFTVVTYTKVANDVTADREKLEILWGDGSLDTIFRTNGNTNPKSSVPEGEIIDADKGIRKNVYVGTHAYAGASTYTISVEDPNRNEGVNNIPYSINVPFYIETILTINPFLGYNNSPQLLNPPIDDAAINKIFMHNPGAYDVDGDSLAYKLITCKGESGNDITGYTMPTATYYISIDDKTGDLVWNVPNLLGEFNIAILIEEWRSGVMLGSIIRDMQITVIDSDNNPPEIADIEKVCIEAGEILELGVSATDKDGDYVTLSATGGILLLDSNYAVFPTADGSDSVSSTLTWQTSCDHIQKNPYQITFRAEDDNQQISLVDLLTIEILVVGPAPENFSATPTGNSITLNWDISKCKEAVGYKIYRRNGAYGYIPDSCETGVPAYTGYELLSVIPDINTTSYPDNNEGLGLTQGLEYCYMVIAYYEDGAESYASSEACTMLKKDVPIITNVSVNNTDNTNGSIYLEWSAPSEYDSVLYPGPYMYEIYRSTGMQGSNLVVIDTLFDFNDTTYTDTLLNTSDNAYSYQVSFYYTASDDTVYIGSGPVASSIFITIAETDQKLLLSFDYQTPWINDTFVVYRQNPSTLAFDSIGQTIQTTYTDSDLVNDIEYCYRIKSIGSYYASGIKSPLYNYSQIECGTPIDTVAPCPPVLVVLDSCEIIKNTLRWSNPTYESCNNDIYYYNIYYAATNTGELYLLKSVNNPEDTTYIHANGNSVAGCYAVSAIDSNLNESHLSNVICVDNCPEYELPNIFTPNGDGYNDFYAPFPYQFVDEIELKIYNRWGQVVFQSNNPQILWDGTNYITGLNCPAGVYYYVCTVYEVRLTGQETTNLNGFIELVR